MKKIIIFIILFLLYSFSIFSQEKISIIGVGDVILGTNYPSKHYLPRNNGRDLLDPVKDILKSADVTFGNLEGAILDRGATIKRCKKCYSFRMPIYLTDNLADAGFDVMSIANNHIRDFGKKGINSTIEALQNQNIYSAGVLQLPYTTFVIDGIRYGFAAFAPNVGTVSIHKIKNAKRIVRKLKSSNDIVIVSFHGGAEGKRHTRVKRKTEYFYGENRGNVYNFAHSVINAGADVVFGHGPHVTRAVEVYKKRFIAYSLGNFCTYGPFNLRGPNGFAPIIQVNIEKDGSFIDAKIHPIKQIKGRGVVLDKAKQAINEIIRLTKLDGFMDNIYISTDGYIRKKNIANPNQ